MDCDDCDIIQKFLECSWSMEDLLIVKKFCEEEIEKLIGEKELVYSDKSVVKDVELPDSNLKPMSFGSGSINDQYEFNEAKENEKEKRRHKKLGTNI